MTGGAGRPGRRGAGASIWRGRRQRALLLQILLVVVLGGLAALLAAVTAANLRRRGITAGFGFLERAADFGLGEAVPLPVPGGRLLLAYAGAVLLLGAVGVAWDRSRGRPPRLGWLPLAMLLAALGLAAAGELPFASFDPRHSLGFALATGFANTLKVAAAAIVLASAIGVLVGLARLSAHPLLRLWGTIYVETFRNVPLLIQVFFWYFGVLRALPNIRQSLSLGGAFLSNRGLFLPAPLAGPGTLPFLLALAGGLAIAGLLRRGWIALTLLPAAAWAWFGAPVQLSFPALRGFNFAGGLWLSPEFAALLIALSIYSGAFIAEIVRGGILGVPSGQLAAARALGLGHGQAMRLVVIPQALRIMLPPLISQFVAQVKDSSLGVAIAYPELISVSTTVINQTGQVIEMLAVLIAVYMTLNLSLALVLGRREARLAMPA